MGHQLSTHFLTRKQGLFQLFKFDTFSRWVTVCTTAFEVQAHQLLHLKQSCM